MSPPRKNKPKPVRPQGVGEVGAGAPNPAKCRAKQHPAIRRIVDCLVKPAPKRRFFRPFAYGGLCAHPRRDLIVARTSALTKGKAATPHRQKGRTRINT